MILLAFQLLGECISKLSGLPVPGPVIGMFLLFVALLAYGRVPQSLRVASSGLLNNMALLFVPAGVVAFMHAGALRAEWLSISVAVVGSSILTMAVTAWVFLWLAGKK